MSPLLGVRDIAVAFGGLRALKGVSLSIEEGSIVSLIGPNGAGKTTLFNVISGLTAPDGGSLTFDGQDMTRLSADRRVGLGLGRSFQNLGLMIDESVRTNLLAAQHVGASYRGSDVLLRPYKFLRAERQLERNAEDVLALFGLTEMMDTLIKDLSFGAARFVELACVLVERPKLMLLDEPTTGLDIRETDQLLGLLEQLRLRGTTVLVVAHDVRFVMTLCDHVYVLAEGEILAQGSPSAVQRDQAVIDAYLGSEP